jgi:hypothetical protein
MQGQTKKQLNNPSPQIEYVKTLSSPENWHCSNDLVLFFMV